jgi:hypothetical protein
MSTVTAKLEDNKITVTMPNMSPCAATAYKAHAFEHILTQLVFASAAFCLKTDNAIADSEATQIFVMEGTPIENKRITMHPLKVLLANGRQVIFTHMCNIIIGSLPFVPTGHRTPDLSIASLFGIRVLTEAGHKVTFDKH